MTGSFSAGTRPEGLLYYIGYYRLRCGHRSVGIPVKLNTIPKGIRTAFRDDPEHLGV
jgi:hypothetical protein